MPGKKRKQQASSEASSKMWGTSSSASGSSTRRKGGGSRRGGSRPSSSGGGDGSSGASDARIERMFEEIADEDNPSAAGMEGICKLCERLELDPLEDVRVLVLLWKLGAHRKPAEIQKEEWAEGCARLGLDSHDKFRKFVPALDTGFLDRAEFGDFYKFCFQFNRAGTHKTLDKDMVVALLRMCLAGGRVSQHRLDTFCEFLETNKDESYAKITLDQWRSFLDFSYDYVDDGDLEGYDEGESAWPVLIDEYVEYMEKRRKKGKR